MCLHSAFSTNWGDHGSAFEGLSWSLWRAQADWWCHVTGNNTSPKALKLALCPECKSEELLFSLMVCPLFRHRRRKQRACLWVGRRNKQSASFYGMERIQSHLHLQIWWRNYFAYYFSWTVTSKWNFTLF